MHLCIYTPTRVYLSAVFSLGAWCGGVKHDRSVDKKCCLREALRWVDKGVKYMKEGYLLVRLTSV